MKKFQLISIAICAILSSACADRSLRLDTPYDGTEVSVGLDISVLPDQEAFEEPFKDSSWTNGWAPYRLRGIVVAPDEETKRRVQEEMKQYDR